MRKSYQTEWQGVRFSDFAKTSSSELATPEFYSAFYAEFFRRHRNWEDISRDWRDVKELWAEFVLERIGQGKKILSVGCGLGIMEHAIRKMSPDLELYIHEVANTAWPWISAEFPEERKFVGLIPGCLPEGLRFDMIYLSTVDYAMDDEMLVGLLSDLRRFMKEGGRCLLISASFQEKQETVGGKVSALAKSLKGAVSAVLDASGVRSRGQFWGWDRTREEYRKLMTRAGFANIEDGFIDNEHYWIEGR